MKVGFESDTLRVLFQMSLVPYLISLVAMWLARELDGTRDLKSPNFRTSLPISNHYIYIAQIRVL